MKSVLLCVFFALIVQKEGSQASNDFRPIPIPLDQWSYEKREARVGTLQEATETEKPLTSAAIPAHYWEDALRHSVYLTLVRDKIDQLIAKGGASPAADHYTSQEVDDHDLWEKIKNAPFDRIEDSDLTSFGDVTIMAKGRLTQENGGFRFTEDKRSRGNCTDDKCLEGVKAFWSVKRIRQRDEEISPGRYHYELTFSVITHKPKKQKKPLENPVRTFTVRETPPEIIVATPQEQPYYQTVRPATIRPQRAIWFHKNIAPTPSQARYSHHGLDRIFSSIFGDDDEPVEPPPPRYKPNPYMHPSYAQYSKVGYVGLPNDHYQHKKIMPYPYKQHVYKYVRPPLQPPPTHAQHHYVDMDGIINNNYGPPPTDHRHISPSNIVKTTRPANLPTTPDTNTNPESHNITSETLISSNETVSDVVLKEQEAPVTYKPYPNNSKPRPTSMKTNYFPEHIRPPIYNAPPGVFGPMDKKPFKPMPPLKFLHSTKIIKKPMKTDFRPSPQVLDTQFSNHDMTVDSAFRPILVNFTDTEDAEKTEIYHDDIPISNKYVRKTVTKKPPKKHENIKSQRVTTSAPDIITVNSDLEDKDTMQWANVLGAFSKTTPMEPQKPKENEFETTTEPMPNSSSTTSKPTTEKIEESTTSTTTLAPKKRTRPPHKFEKPEKAKKHKRVTTTTKAPEKVQTKKTPDLTPQASSAATGANKSWQPKNETTSTSIPTTSTSTLPTTTVKVSSTTTQITYTTSNTPLPSTTYKDESINKPVQEKSKNRFRQSTLMLKGTSLKHDRWSNSLVNKGEIGTEKKPTPTTTNKHPPRRKGSNFHGYGPTLATIQQSHEEERHEQHLSSYTTEYSKNSDVTTAASSNNLPVSTRPTYEETGDQYDTKSESTSGYSYQDEIDDDDDDIEVKVKTNEEQESQDNDEFIFDLSSTTPSDKTNEIIEEESTVTEQTVVSTTHSETKNKTRCKKKKKHQHLNPTIESVSEDEESAPTTTIASTTKSSSGLGILDELLGSFGYDPTVKPLEPKPTELNEEGSENHEKYLHIDEDFEDFLDTLEDRKRHPDNKGEEEEEQYEDDEKEASDDEVSPFDNDDVNETSRNSSDKEYEDYNDRSYSLLELMAME